MLDRLLAGLVKWCQEHLVLAYIIDGVIIAILVGLMIATSPSP